MNTTERALLRPREAAEYLSISERSLWNHTSPRGDIKSVSIGRSVRYAKLVLDRWVEFQMAKKGK